MMGQQDFGTKPISGWIVAPIVAMLGICAGLVVAGRRRRYRT